MEVNAVTEQVIGAAIEVHRVLGPGLLEEIYRDAMCVEFEIRGLEFAREVMFPVIYKGRNLGKRRIDLIVEGIVIVELKSVERMDPVFDAQLLSYLKLTGKKVGLLINFNKRLVKDGIKRFIL